MTKQVINLGTPNGRNGDAIRDAFQKVNDNFEELYALNGNADLTELAQDYAALMFTTGTHSGVAVSYDDQNNRLNLTVILDGGTASTQF